jgi:glycosyltransferase involved in cell wall biosynthesis
MESVRALILTTHVAPSIECGRQVTHKFCKYLPHFGWEPRVLTFRLRYGIDERLLRELPAGLTVDRVYIPSLLDEMVRAAKFVLRCGAKTAASATPAAPAATAGNRERHGLLGQLSGVLDRLGKSLDRTVMIPDTEMLSIPVMAARTVRLIRQWRPRLLLVIAPGFSPYVAGAIAQGVTRIPMVVDYMDAWHGDLMREWVPTWRRSVELALEKWCLRHCAGIAAPSVTYLENIQGIARAAGIHVPGLIMTAGFDPEDFPSSPSVPAPVGRLELLHAGRIFKGRRTDPLLAAVGEMRQQRQLTDEDLGITFMGIVETAHQALMQRLIGQYHLERMVTVRPWVPWETCLKMQAAASGLLVLGHEGPGAAGMMTMKLLEYAGARRPVLALFPPGEAREFVQRSGIGRTASMSDKEEIKTAIAKLLADWKQGRPLFQPREDYLRQFHWPQVTGRLARFLDQVAGVHRLERSRVPDVLAGRGHD